MSLKLLEEDIRSDIDERKEVLLRTKTFAQRYNLNEVDKDYFLRYSIPIVYSVWEGFIQTSFQNYIRAVNRLDLKKEDIALPLLVKVIERDFPQFYQYRDLKSDKKEDFLIKIDSFFKSTDIINITPEVNAKSNVRFEELNDILEALNFNKIQDRYIPENKSSIKDGLKRFVNELRNNISHGNINSINIEFSDLEKSIKLIEFLMEIIFDEIIDGYKTNKYLK